MGTESIKCRKNTEVTQNHRIISFTFLYTVAKTNKVQASQGVCVISCFCWCAFVPHCWKRTLSTYRCVWSWSSRTL